MYKLMYDSGSVIRLSDGACIPPEPLNRDWQRYQAWVAAGNKAEAADEPDPNEAKITAQKQAAYEAVIKNEVLANPGEYPELADSLGVGA